MKKYYEYFWDSSEDPLESLIYQDSSRKSWPKVYFLNNYLGNKAYCQESSLGIGGRNFCLDFLVLVRSKRDTKLSRLEAQKRWLAIWYKVLLDPKMEHFLPEGTITTGLIYCYWWECIVKWWNITCRNGLGPGEGGAWLCSTLPEMLKTYHSKAIREPSTRIQVNFWYRK